MKIKIFQNRNSLLTKVEKYIENSKIKYDKDEIERIFNLIKSINSLEIKYRNQFFFYKKHEQANLIGVTNEELDDFVNFEPIKTYVEKELEKSHEGAYNSILKKMANDEVVSKFDMGQFLQVSEILKKNATSNHTYIYSSFKLKENEDE